MDKERVRHLIEVSRDGERPAAEARVGDRIWWVVSKGFTEKHPRLISLNVSSTSPERVYVTGDEDTKTEAMMHRLTAGCKKPYVKKLDYRERPRMLAFSKAAAVRLYLDAQGEHIAAYHNEIAKLDDLIAKARQLDTRED